MILSNLQIDRRIERTSQKATPPIPTCKDIRNAIDAAVTSLQPQIQARNRAEQSLRNALTKNPKSAEEILDAANQIFEKNPSRQEMNLLADSIRVYLNAKGVVGIKTIIDTLIGKSKTQKHLPEFGRYQANTKSSELQALAECVAFALDRVRQPLGNAFGPDHTFQRSQAEASAKAEILKAVNAACELSGPSQPSGPEIN